MSEGRVRRKLAAILAADVVGYSRMIGNDEVGTLARLKALRADPVDRIIAAYGGRIVKEIGDGFLAEFASVVDAVQCAADIQAALATSTADATGEPIRFRIGVNLGDVVVEDDDLFGDGVNVASRLEGLAEPGGVCISGNAFEQVHQRLDLPFENMGPQSLKNIAKPVHAYRLIGGTMPAGQVAPKPTRRLMTAGLGLVVMALAVAGGGVIWWQQHQGASREPTAISAAPANAPAALPVATDRRLKIAVLPFETSATSEDNKWLGEGIAEDVMTELSRFRDIGVIARNSSFRYGPEPAGIAALREDLGADFVLQGSARLLGKQMRLSLQLVDTGSGTNIWAERYDRPFDDVFTVKADIVEQITARLVDEAYDAANARLADRNPNSLDAFEQVMRARWHYYRFTRDDTKQALVLAERAVGIDPDYAAGWEMLSRVLFQFYVQPYDERRGDPAILERGIAAAQKAVALDPRNSTAIATLGSAQIWAGRHDAGLQDLRRAIELNPSDATALGYYADALSRAGYQEESLEAWAESTRLDPLVLPINKALIARSHVLLGEYETAFGLTSECLRRAPKILPCHLFNIMAAGGLGRTEDVEASVAAIRELAPNFSVSGWRDIIKFGNDEEAETLSNFLIEAGLTP